MCARAYARTTEVALHIEGTVKSMDTDTSIRFAITRAQYNLSVLHLSTLYAYIKRLIIRVIPHRPRRPTKLLRDLEILKCSRRTYLCQNSPGFGSQLRRFDRPVGSSRRQSNRCPLLRLRDSVLNKANQTNAPFQKAENIDRV